jgi:hypothetical protein
VISQRTAPGNRRRFFWVRPVLHLGP